MREFDVLSKSSNKQTNARRKVSGRVSSIILRSVLLVHSFVSTVDYIDALSPEVVGINFNLVRAETTVGVQTAYLKDRSKRSLQPLQLRFPQRLERSGLGKSAGHLPHWPL